MMSNIKTNNNHYGVGAKHLPNKSEKNAARGTENPAASKNKNSSFKNASRDKFEKGNTNTSSPTYNHGGHKNKHVRQAQVCETCNGVNNVPEAPETKSAQTSSNVNVNWKIVLTFMEMSTGKSFEEAKTFAEKTGSSESAMMFAKMHGKFTGSITIGGGINNFEACHLDSFKSLSYAYDKFYEFFKMKFGDNDNELGKRIVELDASFKAALEIAGERTASSVSWMVIQYENGYTQKSNPFLDAAMRHAKMFSDIFLAGYKSGFESALDSALKSLTEMPQTTSFANISASDLSILFKTMTFAANSASSMKAANFELGISYQRQTSKEMLIANNDLSVFMKSVVTESYSFEMKMSASVNAWQRDIARA